MKNPSCSCRRPGTQIDKVTARDLRPGDAILMSSGHAGQPINRVTHHVNGTVEIAYYGIRETQTLVGSMELIVERDPRLWWIGHTGQTFMEAITP